MRCYVEGAIVSEPGLRTIEQCVAALVDEEEGCEGDTDQRRIVKAGRLVGYIDITR